MGSGRNQNGSSSSLSTVPRGGSVREVKFGASGSKRSRHGSQGTDSDSLNISQKEVKDEDARLIYVNDPSRSNERFEFSGNSIRTGKYSVITFLPRNLFEQFHRVAYIYFLVIVVLNQIPQLAVFGRWASVLPLAFVLLVTASKDAYEDWRRHGSDRIENNRLASVFVDNDQLEKKRWKHVRVGDVVKIYCNETLPCDIVLLSTSDPTGVAYVQTLNLDGESNLKTRYAKLETSTSKKETTNFRGVVKSEKPNRNIYGFQATMEVDGKILSLGPSNILLRGCELKNTSWAIGLAVYCGLETKAMLNSSGSPSKRSRLETKMNREILILSFFLVVLCSITSALAAVWLRRHRDELDYLPYYRRKDFSSEGEVEDYDYYGWGWEIVFTFLMCVIVFQILIPISLYISMELVRLGQAYFMIGDREMFDDVTGSSFQCRALNINEDLGQIKYVFSDKTGTLTENKMEFKCATVHGVDYSRTRSFSSSTATASSGRVIRPRMTVKTDPDLVRMSAAADSETEEGKCVRDFFIALAACNTIIPLVDYEGESIDYQGESPDEQALVYAAAAYGFALVERTSGYVVIDVHGQKRRYSVLGMHEFDSDRKRMSVVLGLPDGTVRVFVKGADTAMFGVAKGSAVAGVTEAHLNDYSAAGLRTLVVGVRGMSAAEFEQWQSSYEAASSALMGRSRMLRRVALNLEVNLTVVGASGVEDKLQSGVPEAIESLRTAGMKVWVLTGDKQETAVSIGHSSKLLTGRMTRVVINSNSKSSCAKSLDDARRAAAAAAGPVALIIDGTSLVYILDTDLEDRLFDLARDCSAVLCCRVAPLQKAGIVALIKKRADGLTLAIGDGANDVSMIQKADVGVGMSGQEGRQAVMASDFAVGQFRFLVTLLLTHGHWNYERMAYMILYNFYRNAVLVLVLFWYVMYTRFTLTTAINDWSSVLYSVVYTALPTIVVAVLDKDLGRRTLSRYPRIYRAGQRGDSYGASLFWATVADAVWQSAVVFFVPVFNYWKTPIDVTSIGDVWTLSVVILVNLHLAMDVVRWSWIIHASIWGSILATFVCVIIIDVIPSLPGHWAVFYTMGRGSFWLCLVGTLIAAILPRFVFKAFSEYIRPSDIQIAREAEKLPSSAVEIEAARVEMAVVT